jgi:hypothetical protein
VLASRAYVEGALDLLYVVVAVQVLGGGGADAGWMNTAYGGGAVLGAAASTMLIGRRALWPAIAVGTIVAVAALFGLGVADDTGVAAALFVAIGTGSALLLVASRTLLQRVTDLELLCHAFAFAEAGDDTMLMLGGLTVPVIVAVLAPQWAGAGVALVLLVAVASQLMTVARADRRAQAPIERIELLRRVELFSLLSAPALETLAREAQPRTVPRGTAVIRQGEAGDVFYVVVAGSFTITRGDTALRTVVSGDGFGELALLFDTGRTATVTALEDSEVLAIGRDAFLIAVTGEQATVHGVAAYVQMLDHSLGVWPGIAPREIDGGSG